MHMCANDTKPINKHTNENIEWEILIQFDCGSESQSNWYTLVCRCRWLLLPSSLYICSCCCCFCCRRRRRRVQCVNVNIWLIWGSKNEFNYKQCVCAFKHSIELKCWEKEREWERVSTRMERAFNMFGCVIKSKNRIAIQYINIYILVDKPKFDAIEFILALCARKH